MYKFTLLFIFFLYSCASIKYPEGGPKDEIPPNIVRITPDLPKTHFQNKKIIIKFDEYIKNEDYTKEILFSPLMKSPYKVLTYGKKIKILLPNDISNEYTYLLTIKNGIKDFNEGNKLQSILQFPFTKSQIFDTCSIEGKLILAHPKLKLENFFVFLYEYDSVTNQNFHNKKPLYFGIVNEKNEYKIPYIKNGKYKILAVQDKNNDFLYNEGENVGIDTVLSINMFEEPSVEWDLICFPNDYQAPKIKKSYWKDSLTYSVEFNEPILKDSLIWKSSISTQAIVTDEKIDFFFPFPPKDSIKISFFSLIDTLGNAIDTTINFSLTKTNSPNTKFQMTQPEITPYLWIIKANYPLNEKFLSKITIQDTSGTPLKIPLSIKNNLLIFDVSNTSLDTNQIYTIIIDSTFLSYQNQKLDSTLKFYVKPILENEFYGYLKINIETEYSNFLGILKNTQTKEVIKFKDKTHVFDRLKPGKYQLTIINDDDQNGLWTTGNLNTLKLPEKIYLFSQDIDLKPKMKIENLNIKVQ